MWPVRVASLGPLCTGSVLWRAQGRLYVTAIVKATFAFSLNDEMSCVAPEPLRRADECARGVPSLRGASEIAPRLLEVDVFLCGHAYARAGSIQSVIRLAIEREGRLDPSAGGRMGRRGHPTHGDRLTNARRRA